MSRSPVFLIARLLLLAALAPAVPGLAPSALAAPKKALFDNTHQETAGNADWQIDTDQPLPLPSQTTVTWATPRTYWVGAISSWAIDLVKRGYSVATLTTTYGVTYGNAGNPYDLSNYDVFIVDEPNTRFTAAESTAIFNYIRDGGGLVAVSDHGGSDRNSDGVDSPKAWGRLDRLHLWGAHFDSTGEVNNNISQDSGNEDTAPDNPVTHGPVGVADSLSFHNGATMMLYPATNPAVRGDVWMNGLAHGTSGVMAAHSSYGSGRIVFIGDSSPCDDGSAAPGNSSIYDGWGEVSGRDSILIMNGTIWATRPSGDATPPAVSVTAPNGGESWIEGTAHAITWTATDNTSIDSVNVDYSLHGTGGPWIAIQHRLANSGSLNWVVPGSPSDSALVRVTAFDPTKNQGGDRSDALFSIALDTSSVPDGGVPRPFLVRPPAPNPSRGPVAVRFSLPEPGSSVRLEITDVSGRHVRRISRDAAVAGEQSLTWDGRDSAGKRVAAGLYFIRLDAGGTRKATVRVVIIK